MSRRLRAGTAGTLARSGLAVAVLLPLACRLVVKAIGEPRLDRTMVMPPPTGPSHRDPGPPAPAPPHRRGDTEPGVAVVLGAGLRPDGRPGRVLSARVEAAARLWHQGRVDLLVMSGADDGNGDQPRAMAALAVELEVDPGRIELDPSGVDTASSCRFAAERWPDRRIVFVTQSFHAHRTAYLAGRAGLDAVVAVVDDGPPNAALVRARCREIPAAVKALALDRFPTAPRASAAPAHAGGSADQPLATGSS